MTATKTVTGPFFESLPATYTITLTNAGPGVQPDNPGHEMEDVLPGGTVALISVSASSGSLATIGDIPCVPTCGNVVWWDGSIPAGGTVTITIQVRVREGSAGQLTTNHASYFFDIAGDGTNGGFGVSNFVDFVPRPASEIPAMSHIALFALALTLALLALRK